MYDLSKKFNYFCCYFCWADFLYFSGRYVHTSVQVFDNVITHSLNSIRFLPPLFMVIYLNGSFISGREVHGTDMIMLNNIIIQWYTSSSTKFSRMTFKVDQWCFPISTILSAKGLHNSNCFCLIHRISFANVDAVEVNESTNCEKLM